MFCGLPYFTLYSLHSTPLQYTLLSKVKTYLDFLEAGRLENITKFKYYRVCKVCGLSICSSSRASPCPFKENCHKKVILSKFFLVVEYSRNTKSTRCKDKNYKKRDEEICLEMAKLTAIN